MTRTNDGPRTQVSPYVHTPYLVRRKIPVWGSHHILDVLSFLLVDEVNALPLVQNKPHFSADDDTGHGGRACRTIIAARRDLLGLSTLTFHILPG